MLAKKGVRKADFQRIDRLVKVIGLDAIKSHLYVPTQILSKAYIEDQDFKTLDRHMWTGVSPFDDRRAIAQLSATASSFKYMLKTRSGADFAISVNDVAVILKHAVTFYILGAEPEFMD